MASRDERGNYVNDKDIELLKEKVEENNWYWRYILLTKL